MFAARNTSVSAGFLAPPLSQQHQRQRRLLAHPLNQQHKRRLPCSTPQPAALSGVPVPSSASRVRSLAARSVRSLATSATPLHSASPSCFISYASPFLCQQGALLGSSQRTVPGHECHPSSLSKSQLLHQLCQSLPLPAGCAPWQLAAYGPWP